MSFVIVATGRAAYCGERGHYPLVCTSRVVFSPRRLRDRTWRGGPKVLPRGVVPHGDYFSCPGMCCLPLDVSSCFGLAPCLDPREGLVCCDSGVVSRPYVAADLRLAHQPYRPLGASHLNGRVSRGPWGRFGGNVGRLTWSTPDTGMTLNYRATYPRCGPAFGPPPPPPP